VAGFQAQLGGDVPLLSQLRVRQALLVMFEIGAGILPVRIEEEGVEIIAQVIVVGDIAARPTWIVALPQSWTAVRARSIRRAGGEAGAAALRSIRLRKSRMSPDSIDRRPSV
jgi:hypothetical protein